MPREPHLGSQGAADRQQEAQGRPGLAAIEHGPAACWEALVAACAAGEGLHAKADPGAGDACAQRLEAGDGRLDVIGAAVAVEVGRRGCERRQDEQAVCRRFRRDGPDGTGEGVWVDGDVHGHPSLCGGTAELDELGELAERDVTDLDRPQGPGVMTLTPAPWRFLSWAAKETIVLWSMSVPVGRP